MIPPRLQKGDPFGKLMNYWNMLIDHLYESRLVSGYGVSVSRRPAGTIVSISRARSGSGSGAMGLAPTGPFAVEILTDNSGKQTVTLHNSRAPDGETAGLVTIGSFRETVKKQTYSPKAGVLFLDVVYNSEKDSYSCSFALETRLPETKDEKRYIYRIAEITWNSEKKVYYSAQIHPVGDIEVKGRWVK